MLKIMSNELIDDIQQKDKKMQQQIKQNIACSKEEETDNPQLQSIIINDKKIKQSHSKKKKEFKIKKTNLSKEKKSRKEEGFSNPIYAGFDGEDVDNENRVNFGPWMRESVKLINGSSVSSRFELENKPMIMRRQNHSNSTRYQRYDSDNNNDTTPTEETNINNSAKRRYLHEIRLTLQMPKTKSVTLSSIKPMREVEENEQQLLSKNLNKSNRSSSSSVDLLKYNSLKYLIQFRDREKSTTIDNNNNKYMGVLVKSPNKVIYNYCCSTIDNNLFGNDLCNILINSKQDKKKGTGRNELKQQQLKDKPSSRQRLTPIKKSINRELYDELIKKKSRVK